MNRRLTAQTFHIWTRNKHRINLSCPFAVVIACFIALYLTLSSFALTGSQKRISYLDGHDASITISQTQTTLRPAQGTVIDRLRKSGARNISVITTGSSFQIDGLRTTGLSTGFHDRIQYMEWASGSPASRYHLTTGHWPSSPGEVALSEPLAARLHDPSRIHVFSDTSRLRVVGTFHDAYATDALVAIGAASGWKSMSAAASKGYPSLSPIVEYVWDGLPLSTAIPLFSTLYGTPTDSLVTSSRDGAKISASPQVSLASRSPYLVMIPCLLLTGAVQLTVMARIATSIRAQRQSMLKLGIPLSATLASSLGSVLAICLAAWSVGVCGGWILGMALRRFLVPHLLTQPISPPVSIAPLAMTLLALTVAMSIAAIPLTGPRAGGRNRTTPHHARSATTLRWVRRVAGVLLIIGGLLALQNRTQLDDVIHGAIFVSSGAVLLMPDLISGIISVIKLPTPAGLLAVKTLHFNDARIRIMGSALCLCLVIPASVNVIMTSYQQSTAALSMAPPDTLILQSPDSNPVPKDLPRSVQAATGMKRAVKVDMLSGEITSNHHSGTAQAVMVVSSPEDAERVLNMKLTTEERTHLNNSFMLSFSDGPAKTILALDDGRRAAIPSSRVEVNPTWAYIYGGVIVKATLERIRAQSIPHQWVYTGVQKSGITQAVNYVHRQGLDPQLLTYHVEPEPPQMPFAWWTVCLTLVIIAAGITASVSASLGHIARNQSRQLLAIGLPKRLGAMIPILESMLLVGLCSVIASVLAIVPVVVGRSLSESFTLWVPKDWVILWCAGLGLLIVLSPLAGLRAIRARERTADALI